MISSKQKVKDLCDKLMQVSPEQIVIDLVQEKIEETLNSDDVTPDDVGALTYQTSILHDIYNPFYEKDKSYMVELMYALQEWEQDLTFANKTLGLDPNQ